MTPLLAFLTARGYDPVSPDPFRATFTFSVDGDELELTVDGDLDIVEAVERTGPADD